MPGQAEETATQRMSELETDLSRYLQPTAPQHERTLEALLFQMAAIEERRMYVTTYPACNSD